MLDNHDSSNIANGEDGFSNAMCNDVEEPLYKVEIPPNTFAFYVHKKRGCKVVKVIQHTDFTGTVLEEDFPDGSTIVWESKVLETYSDTVAVNIVGAKLLENWECL
jgi:hypothetical protein